jgi:mannitol-specific phosphotransferase system IIBC component
MAKLTDVPGIGPAAAKLLAEHKIKTVEALAAVGLADLKAISGFGGDIRARAVKKAAADCLKNATAKSGVAAEQVTVPAEIIKQDKNKKKNLKDASKKEKSAKKKNKEEKKAQKKKKKNKKDKKK